MAFASPSLKGRALRLLSQREHSRTELERARGVWQRRFDALPADAKERAKQGRFLLARGFSGAVVGRVLRSQFDD